MIAFVETVRLTQSLEIAAFMNGNLGAINVYYWFRNFRFRVIQFVCKRC